MRETLKPEQLAALQRFADDYGRCWKSKLNDYWMSGFPIGFPDASLLQQVRNTLGPSWLVRFKLAAAKEDAEPKAPFRLFDVGEAEYYEARTLYGDHRAHEDGTIQTVKEAAWLRREVALMFGCSQKGIEIHDAQGVTVESAERDAYSRPLPPKSSSNYEAEFDGATLCD